MVQGLRILITCLYRQTVFHEIPLSLQARVGLEKDPSFQVLDCSQFVFHMIQAKLI